MSTGAPVAGDDEARVAIGAGLDFTYFVEAGAGTGKTTALVGRIVELVVTGGASLGEIAAITFTEAAAAELRDRVREALERTADGDGEAAGVTDGAADGTRGGVADGATDGQRSGDPGASSWGPGGGERRRRAAAAIEEIDAAAIGTLHGFARRILGSYPLEAGLPPLFGVLDPARSAVAFDERWKRFVDELVESPALREPLRRLLVCGVRIDHLRSVAEQYNDNWDLLIPATPELPESEPIDASPVVALLDAACAAGAACRASDDLLAVHVEKLRPVADGLRNAGSDLDALRRLVEAPAIASKRGRAANWSCPVADVRALLADAESARRSLVDAVATTALRRITAEIRALTLRGADERRRAGVLEFHDLLVRALDLVRTDAAVRVALHRRFRYLLIDEFQDTDPIQAELAVRIADGSTDPGPGEVPWIELGVPSGRLFFVGDPKQSIYRFRRADIAQFLAVRHRHRAGRLSLTANFRSVPGVVAWVNHVFGELLGDGEEGVQPAYEALEARRPAQLDSAGGADDAAGGDPPAPVVLLGGPLTARSAADIRAAEASEVADTIVGVVAERWPVGPAGRPARLSDIAILLPTRTGLPTLQSALDNAGIAYRLESSSLVYESPEIVELVTVLRAIDDPGDQVAIVAALRSASLGCGDDDLVAYRAAGGRWDYRQVPPGSLPADHPVVAGLAWLHRFHRQRWWQEVSSLVEAVLEEGRFLELGIDRRRTRDIWRRLRFVVDQARVFADTSGGGLGAYLAWVELQRSERARMTEVVLPETDDDAVRVMTVHGAKGLEFPIAVLVGLGREPRRPSGPRVLWGSAGPEAKIPGGLVTAGYADLAAREERMDRAQELRLLYVAATRARDHLVVSLHHKEGSDCHASRLLPVCDSAPDLARRIARREAGAGPSDGTAPPGSPGTPREAHGRAQSSDDGEHAGIVGAGGGADDGEHARVDGDLAERRRWIAERERLTGPGSRPRTLAATTVAALAGAHAERSDPDGSGAGRDSSGADPGPGADPGSDTDSGVDVDLPPWRRGRAGTAMGRAVHGVLQTVDLATGAGLDALAATQAVAEAVHGRSAEIAGRARAALGADIVREAVSGGRYWKELYVGAPVTGAPDGPVIEGFIDLLVETPSGYVVVDYKTDEITTPGQLDRAMDRYRLQGATYALAVERALGRPVVRCVFVFVGVTGRSVAVEREVVALREAMDEVETLVSQGPAPVASSADVNGTGTRSGRVSPSAG